MEMITKNKKISLVYRTSKIVKITNLLDGKSFEEVYFKALTEKNLESLSKIILYLQKMQIQGYLHSKFRRSL